MTDRVPGEATAGATPQGPPDYDLADVLELSDAAQYRALFEDTRREIVSLLLERAATTSELAEVLARPKGTIGHHLKVLADAGLVHIVRTKRVRALEAKYYGRVARVFIYRREHEAVAEEERVLVRAAADIARVSSEAPVSTANVRYVRIADDRAQEWKGRMESLLMEFAEQPPDGQTTYALAFGLYPTTRPPLRPIGGER